MATFLHHTLPASMLVQTAPQSSFLTWGDDDRRRTSISSSSSSSSLSSAAPAPVAAAPPAQVQFQYQAQHDAVMSDMLQQQQAKRGYEEYQNPNDHMMEQGYGYAKRRCFR